MIIKYSSNFEDKYKKLVKRDSRLANKLDEKFKLLIVNPRHPSLRLHKIQTREDAWSISVDMKIRILFVYRSYGILLVEIGSHDEVY